MNVKKKKIKQGRRERKNVYQKETVERKGGGGRGLKKRERVREWKKKNGYK